MNRGKGAMLGVHAVRAGIACGLGEVTGTFARRCLGLVCYSVSDTVTVFPRSFSQSLTYRLRSQDILPAPAFVEDIYFSRNEVPQGMTKCER